VHCRALGGFAIRTPLSGRPGTRLADPVVIPESPISGRPYSAATRVLSRPDAARLLPCKATRLGPHPVKADREAPDQGCCGVEVRVFEPLASSVRVSDALPLCRAAFPQVLANRQGRS
jgi:hypothetical protein